VGIEREMAIGGRDEMSSESDEVACRARRNPALHQFDDVGDLDGVRAHTQDGERLGVRDSGLRSGNFGLSILD